MAWDGATLHVANVSAQAGQVPVLVSTRAVHVSAVGGALDDSDPRQLRRVLDDVCRGRQRSQIWAALDSPAAFTQVIRVPVVRDGLLSNVALWTLHKERSVAVEGSVLDLDVLRTVDQDGVRQIELLAAVAPQAEISALSTEFRSAGHPLAGVTLNALAFRNVMRFAWSDANQRQRVLVCVNDASTDVLLFSDGRLLGTRSVRTGIDSLRHAFAQHLDADVEDARVDECMGVLRGEPLPATAADSDPTRSVDDVFGWVRPAARRLVRNVQRALHGFEVMHGVGDAALFLVTGRIVAYPLVCRFLGTQLGVQLSGLTDSSRAEVLRASSPDASEAAETGHGRAVAIGLALAAVYTTGNLLFTFEDRLRERRRRRMETASLGVAAAVLAVLLGAVGVLQANVHGLQRECEGLRASLASSGPRHDGLDTAAMAARVGAAQAATRRLAQTYYAPALVAEVAALTAPPVHLLTLDLRLAGEAAGRGSIPEGNALARTVAGRRAATRPAGEGTDPAQAERSAVPKLVIRGVIAGRRDRVDSELAAYLLRLRQSPFLDSPRVTEQRAEAVDSAYLGFGPPGSDQVLFFGVEATCRPWTSSTGALPPTPPEPARQTAQHGEGAP